MLNLDSSNETSSSIEAAKPRKIILEIGIGLGGPHILEDLESNTLRIGIDLNFQRLTEAVSKYKDISPLIANAWTKDKNFGLPVKSQSVDEVKIFFPHDTLMYALCASEKESSLWNELFRIIKPNGSIEIVFDVARIKKIGGQGRVLEIPNEENVGTRKIVIENPQFQMLEQAAKKHKFELKLSSLNQQQTQEIGTHFANRFSYKYFNGQIEGGIYRVIATKRNN